MLPCLLTIYAGILRLSGLSLDMFRQLLTNSWFPPGDVEKPSPVTVAGALDWQAKANAETNGETENEPNPGQLGHCGGAPSRQQTAGKSLLENSLAPQDIQNTYRAAGELGVG